MVEGVGCVGCRAGVCLGLQWLQGAGSSEIMLLVTDCVRLVVVRSDSEVNSHVQLGVERYARGKPRPCVLCMHHDDEPSNDSATNQATTTESTSTTPSPRHQLH